MSNPYESARDPGGSQLIEGGKQRVKLRKIGVLSLGIFLGAAGVLAGIFGSVFIIVLGIVRANEFEGNEAAAMAGVGLAVAIIAPIFYGVIGFVGGASYALIFNALAAITGGLEIELSN